MAFENIHPINHIASSRVCLSTNHVNVNTLNMYFMLKRSEILNIPYFRAVLE